MATTPSLTVDLTPKVVKVTAEVELHVDGRCVGTATVDLTPQDESETSSAGDVYVVEQRLHEARQQQSRAARP